MNKAEYDRTAKGGRKKAKIAIEKQRESLRGKTTSSAAPVDDLSPTDFVKRVTATRALAAIKVDPAIESTKRIWDI